MKDIPLFSRSELSLQNHIIYFELTMFKNDFKIFVVILHSSEGQQLTIILQSSVYNCNNLWNFV